MSQYDNSYKNTHSSQPKSLIVKNPNMRSFYKSDRCATIMLNRGIATHTFYTQNNGFTLPRSRYSIQRL